MATMEILFVALNTSKADVAALHLDRIFDHWDKDKTKLILTALESCYQTVFLREAQRHWLPRCIAREFEAESLMPEARGPEAIMFELITKHGMKRFVVDAMYISDVSKFFDDHRNLSCKVWYLEAYKESEPSVRGYGPDNYEEMAKEYYTRCEQAEKKLLTMTEEAKKLNDMTNKYMKIAEEETTRREQAEEKVLSMIKELEKLRLKNNQELDDMKKDLSLLEVEKEENSRELQKLNDKLLELQSERDKALKDVELCKQKVAVRSSDFTLKELEEATDNFSESLKISKGAYGCVYKGYLRGIHVAIKILNAQSTELISAFKQEVAILTTARHPNLVTLIGACYEASALVYEFLPNGSLENHLNHSNNTIPLTWQLRTRIICEICLALIFLHSNKPNMVIHGDLKPDNVLLDANFVSKLGDFGISRLIQQSDTNATLFHLTYNPVGTPGYMDPDYVYTGKLTEKSDVFSLGVIILRLLTGEPASGIVFKVQKAMENETLHKMMDVSAGKWPFDQAKELASLALRCVEMKRSDRPNLFNEVWPIVERLRRNL